MDIKAFIAFAVLGVFVSGVAAQDSPPAIIEQVAFVGDPAPGIPELVFSYFNRPKIDGAGNVIFLANVYGPGVHAGNNTAIFYGPPSDLQKLIWASEPAPGMPEGVVISSLMWAGEHLSEAGWASFAAFVSGPGVEPGFNDRVLYVGPPDDLQVVVQAGDQAIGCEPGAYYGSEWFGGHLSDNSTLLVGSVLGGTGIYADQGVWIGTRDSLELVYRKNMAVPGFPEGVHFDFAHDFVHNDAGHVAFFGKIDGPGITMLNDEGRWLGAPGALDPIVREGDPVPCIGEGVTFLGVAVSTISNTNNVGDATECGLLQGEGITEDNDRASFLVTGGELYLLDREGAPVPDAGDGASIEYINMPKINNRNEVFYGVKYRGEGISEENDFGVHYRHRGNAQLLLKDSGPAPAFPSEITMGQVGRVVADMTMNDVGDFIGPSQIQGAGVTDDNNVVLWMRHHIIQRCIPLLRSGDVIDGHAVWAEDAGTFGESYCDATTGSDGKYQSFNNLGMLAMCIIFTDGTHGIYRISPPIFGDADEDQDTDFADWLVMAQCHDGPDADMQQDCEVFDLDADGDVDLTDQSMFQQLFTG